MDALENDPLTESESTKRESGATKISRLGTFNFTEKNPDTAESEPYSKKNSKKSVGFHPTVDVVYVESFKQYNKFVTTKKKKQKVHCNCSIM